MLCHQQTFCTVESKALGLLGTTFSLDQLESSSWSGGPKVVSPEADTQTLCTCFFSGRRPPQTHQKDAPSTHGQGSGTPPRSQRVVTRYSIFSGVAVVLRGAETWRNSERSKMSESQATSGTFSTAVESKGANKPLTVDKPHGSPRPFTSLEMRLLARPLGGVRQVFGGRAVRWEGFEGPDARVLPAFPVEISRYNISPRQGNRVNALGSE